uniref:Methyltransferase domain-containing protein n=1 Tax=viral metagenome TaxID=1070528 RepID=A0A6C0H4T4_9ZZZZ
MSYINLLYFIVLLQIIIYVILKSTCVLTNKNTLITLTIWFLCIYLAYYFNNTLYLLCPIFLLMLNELLYVKLNIDGFDGESRTKLFYDITSTYYINYLKKNTNLTEGIYLKDLSDNTSLMNEREAKEFTPEMANIKKYEKFFLYLNISPSEYKTITILDMGCGNGDFIKYCKSLGIKTSAMSISSEQANALKEQNHDVYLGSYRDFQPQFVGKYDIVTFWGSLEHLTQSYPCSKSGEQKAEKELIKIMNHVKRYYKHDSSYKLLFSTTLHMNKKVCKDTLNAYLVERAYGGWYFYDEIDETLSDKIKSIGFNKIKQDDFTYHYYMASKIDQTHFGRPMNPTLYNMFGLVFGIFINPNIIAMVLYTLRGEWMWQFDNKVHYFDRECQSCSIVERSIRPTTLLWSVNKLISTEK